MAKTILLADDSVTIQKVVELTFMDEDYEVVAVNDGSSALAKLSEVSPDLVISDVHMPGANGYEVCRKVKAAKPGVPVVLLVGTFEPFDNDKATVVGADTHLKKPFDSQDLLRVVLELTSGESAEAPAAEDSGLETGPFAALGVSDTGEVEPLVVSPEAEPAAEEAAAPPDPPQEGAEPDAFETRTELDVAPAATVEAFAPDIESRAPEEQPLVLEETGPMTAPVFEEEKSTAEPEASTEPEAAPETAAAEPAIEPEVVTEPEAAPEAAAPEAEALVEPETAAEAEPQEAAEREAAGEAVPAAVAAGNGAAGLSDEDVERIARRVLELAGDSVLREVAWEVVPDLAEVVIKERIRELESQVE